MFASWNGQKAAAIGWIRDTSASGTFGLIVSISLFAHAQPWSNVWERL